jgi:hypothetical protein
VIFMRDFKANNAVAVEAPLSKQADLMGGEPVFPCPKHPFAPAKEEPFPSVLLANRSLKAQKTPPPEPPCWLVLNSCSSVYCPFLCQHPVYSTGTFRNRMPWIVAQTMVKQLISVVNTSIWSVRCRTLLKRLSMALVVLM